jgi:hypothetical protein
MRNEAKRGELLRKHDRDGLFFKSKGGMVNLPKVISYGVFICTYH